MSNDAIKPVDEKSPASKEPDDQWIVNIENLVKGYDTEEIPPTRLPIEQIPSIYGNWKCLDDFGDVMSFLPETNRWEFVSFMKRAFDLKVRECLEELEKNEDKIWRYYCGVDEQFRAENSKSFIEHLLVNSCFLIFALVILAERDRELPNKIGFGSAENDDSKMRTSNEYEKFEKFICGEEIGIVRYMLTMDYQIPLFVVEAVYTKLSNLSSKLNTPIHELVITVFQHIKPEVHKSKLQNNTITVPKDGFQHLLHIFHWSRTPECKFHKTNSGFSMNMFNLPSATYLQSGATVFNMHATSGFDVTFYERILSGVVQLPPMSRFLYENEIYKDLLAFERGYGIVCGFSVTSYIACIVSLVQTEEDVRLLGVKGITPRNEKDLLSYLQGYKTVVLTNDIPVSDDLMDWVFNMRSHNQKRSRIKKYYADFKRRYCSNPWITLSVVGGILLFVLTLIQTVLSFIQTKYSILSYKNQ